MLLVGHQVDHADDLLATEHGDDQLRARGLLVGPVDTPCPQANGFLGQVLVDDQRAPGAHDLGAEARRLHWRPLEPLARRLAEWKVHRSARAVDAPQSDAETREHLTQLPTDRIVDAL
jgi:hypothetical protein